MKVTLLTYGSRGDVQPFMALAAGLQQAGHTVQLAMPERLAGLASQHGIPVRPLPGDPALLSKELNRASHNIVRQILSIRAYVLPLARHVGQLAYESIQDCDLVVHSFLFASGAHTFARQAGVPDVSAQFFPIFAPTRHFTPVGFPEARLPLTLQRWYNLTMHQIGSALFRGMSSNGYSFVRRHHPHWPERLDWPFDAKASRGPSPLLFGISPQILPSAPDWGQHVHVTGYWFFDEVGYQPPSGLSSFLAAGDPPVCIGFGSMLHPRSAAVQRSILNSLQQERQRAVILTGWDGWQEVRDEFSNADFLFLESAPHSWLLPQCRLFIHHGGAGTTAAALRAGIPQWIIPFTADQPFWARRVHLAGAAAQPLKPDHVRNQTAAATLNAALHNHHLRERAAVLGARIRTEDGVARAVEIIQRTATSRG